MYSKSRTKEIYNTVKKRVLNFTDVLSPAIALCRSKIECTGLARVYMYGKSSLFAIIGPLHILNIVVNKVYNSHQFTVMCKDFNF